MPMKFPHPPRESLMQLWKRGWNEIPEIMASSGYLVVALVGLPTWCYFYVKNDAGNHRYKVRYIVHRPEDPRVERIRRFADSPPITRVDPSTSC